MRYDEGIDERRQHSRIKVAMAVHVYGDRVRIVAANMDDVSAGGAFIKTSWPPHVEAHIDIIVLIDENPAISLPATVCRVAEGGVGIAWRTLGDSERSFLDALLRSHGTP